MKPSLVTCIQRDLNLDDNYIKRVLNRRPNDIIFHQIPKRNGGFRIAKEIKLEFKPLQYWISEHFLRLFPVSQWSHAYEAQSSILKNATVHKDSSFFLKVDLKDFFPSVDFASFRKFLAENEAHFIDKYTISDRDELLLKNCCFDEKGALAQGFSTSPMIANRILFGLDNAINELTKSYSKSKVIYSRYSDDLIISCSSRGLSYEIYRRLAELVARWEHPKLTINNEKTSFGSVGRGNVLVTGLKIDRNHEVDVTRQKKDELRLLLSLFRKGTLDRQDFQKLKGNIEFVRYNSPQFYTKLCIKYHFDLVELNRYLRGENNLTSRST